MDAKNKGNGNGKQKVNKTKHKKRNNGTKITRMDAKLKKITKTYTHTDTQMNE